MSRVNKVIVVGDANSGKTSMMNFIKSREFQRHACSPTVGANVVVLKSGGKSGQFWDCGGRHEGMADGYWVGSNAAVVVFDLTSLTAWKNVPVWIESVHKVTGDIPIVVVGHKVDLRGCVDKGTIARGLFAMSRKYPKIKYLEASAKIGYGCDEVVGAVFARL